MAIAVLPLRLERSEARSTGTRYLIAFAVTLASVLELVDTSIVNVAIPHMMGNLGATLEEVAWVSTGYIVANVIVLPLTSWFSVRFGRRNYYTGSIMLFTTRLVLLRQRAHASRRWYSGASSRGSAAARSSPPHRRSCSTCSPSRSGAPPLAIFGMGVMVGPTLGPTLGGWITDNYSWPWIFYINMPLGILAAYLTWSYVPEPRYKARQDGGVDWLGLLFLIVGVGRVADPARAGRVEGLVRVAGDHHRNGDCGVRPDRLRVA